MNYSSALALLLLRVGLSALEGSGWLAARQTSIRPTSFLFVGQCQALPSQGLARQQPRRDPQTLPKNYEAGRVYARAADKGTTHQANDVV